jgi:succinate dehydrogenase / fumarate reductase cytochrome b subunit
VSWLSSYVKSSVGAKHLMAVTGLVLSGFVLGHMAGNLLVLAGQDAINAYAHGIKNTPALLWGTRITLLVAVVVHVAAAVRLTAINRAARPVGYVRFKPVRTPFYARVMPWTGLILFAFIAYHLLHFTLGAVQPASFAEAPGNVDALGRPDVYSMMVHGFRNPLVAGSYLVAMALLWMHLAHGVTSMFQSVGFHHPKYNTLVRYAGPVLAGMVFLGNTLIVLAILTGALALPGA